MAGMPVATFYELGKGIYKGRCDLSTSSAKWEVISGEGQSPVIAAVDPEAGSRKYLEDPFNPGSEAIEALSERLCDMAALITVPCSPSTLEELRRSAHDLDRVIVADNDAARLELWKREFGAEVQGCETLALPQDPVEAEAVLREKLMSFDCDLFLGRCAVYIPQRFKRLCKDLAEFLESKVLYLQREACSMAATRSIHSWRGTLNQLLNAREVEASVVKEPEKAPEIVVIVGAGPSLDSNIMDLKEYSNRAVIISTDAALNTMLEHEVFPNIVASMDSGPLMWRLFVKNMDKLKGIPLAASVSSNRALLSRYPGKILLFADEEQGGFHASLFDELPKVKHGQCVGHFAFHLAESMRPEKIVMVGFDLAYRDGKFHSSGMQYKYDKDFKSSFEGTKSSVQGVSGGMVQTDLSLEFFLKYFEKAIAESRCKVVDATEGGALKRGAAVAKLRDVLSPAPACRSSIETLPGSGPASRRAKVDSFRKFLEGLEPLFAKIKALSAAMTPDSISNPLKLLPIGSPEFETLSACANFLLMAEFSKELSKYEPSRFERFKGKLEALASDLEASAKTAGMALDVASRSWRRDPASVIALLPPGSDADLVSRLISKLAPGASMMPYDSPLDAVWSSMMRLQAGRILCFNGHAVPESWSIPDCSCLDVKTRFEPTPHDKTVWIPGYKMLCVGDDVFEKWSSFVPRDVDCSMLEEFA